jgi:hypothetical protein
MLKVWAATTALLVLANGSALAETAQAASMPVTCEVNGYSVIIFNRGTEAIASETALHWSVPFVLMEGEHTLTDRLAPGEWVYLPNTLGSNYLSKTTPCEASIGPPA